MEINELIEEIVIQEPDDSVGSKLLAAELFGNGQSKGLVALVSRIEAEKRIRKPSVRDLPIKARRAYQAEATRRHRAKLKRNKAEGNPEATTEAIREALADAAIMLLAVNGPGADQVRAYLAKAFPGRVGVPMTVTSRARSGKLKPKSLKSS